MVFFPVSLGMLMNLRTLKGLSIHVYIFTLGWSAFCTNEVSALAYISHGFVTDTMSDPHQGMLQ